ncbi:unnamed protein product [Caenorhabditis brenneri]
MSERFPPRPDYHPQGQKAEILDNQVNLSPFVLTKRHFVLSGGPSHRQAPRSSSPEAASATLGGLLATVREQDRSSNALQGSPRNRGSSRNSSNSYRTSAPNMYGRQEYDHHRSKQQSYRGNGGHKHPRIEHPGMFELFSPKIYIYFPEDWRSDRTPHTGPSYTRSPIRRSSSSPISIGNV